MCGQWGESCSRRRCRIPPMPAPRATFGTPSGTPIAPGTSLLSGASRRGQEKALARCASWYCCGCFTVAANLWLVLLGLAVLFIPVVPVVAPNCSSIARQVSCPCWCVLLQWEAWCYVDPCECQLEETPKTSSYLPKGFGNGPRGCSWSDFSSAHPLT